MTLVYLDGLRITMTQLEQELNDAHEDEKIIELDFIDNNGGLHFETNKYGTYY